MRVRHGRATVTGSRVPEARNSPRRGTLPIGTRDPEEVARDGSGSGVVRRLLLVRHAPTAATRASAFPADEPLDERGVAAARRAARPRCRAAEVLCSPRAALPRDRRGGRAATASVEPALAECDFGALGGRALDELADERPGRRAAPG